MISPRISIRRRLSLLVLSEFVTAALVVVTAIVSLVRLSEESQYLHNYTFVPLVGIGDALETCSGLHATLETPAPGPETEARAREEVEQLRIFLLRYRRDWQVVDSDIPEAVRFREILEREKGLALLDEERRTMDALQDILPRLDRSGGVAGALGPHASPWRQAEVDEFCIALVRLNHVNLRYMEMSYDDADARRSFITSLFVVVGLVGVIAAPLFGFMVQRAIAPRVHLLVDRVRRFRERGVHEPFGEWGGDELAVLAHALDLSFKAIAERNAERERFLADAAHELKTPLTSMKGFAQIALTHRDDDRLRERALSVIERQATRLARLIQDLLWSARAATGDLSFNPGPLDLDALVHRAISEVEMIIVGHEIRLESGGDACIVGDAELVEHGISSLLMHAVTMSPTSAPVRVVIESDPARVRLSVEVQGEGMLPHDLDALLEPFAILHNKGSRGALRSTGLGLHLAREIARLHRASFRIERQDTGVVFVLEVRR